MIEIPDLRAFVRIAELRSISGSARSLGTPKSTISRSLVRLEEALGITLVERSTRNLHLTDAGKLFHGHALRILGDVDEAEAAVGSFSGVPRGSLRVIAPHAFLQGVLAPMLPSFLTRYPAVNVILETEGPRSDPPAVEADIMIRVGPLADSTMVARRLITFELWTCASPAYLAVRGRPSHVADLATHDIVGLIQHRIHWSFHDPDGQTEEVELHPRAVVPDMAVNRVVVAGGAGIGQLPDFMASDAIGRGELIRVLPDMRPALTDLYVLYPSQRSLPAKARVFIDAIVVRAPQWTVFEGAIHDPAHVSPMTAGRRDREAGGR